MKYTKTVQVECKLSEKDIGLLRKPIPKKPCLSCSDSASCCGCSEYYGYVECIKPYKDSGIFEIAENLEYIRNLGKQLEAIKCEYERRVSELPDELKNIL